ncbi:hypothetical protein [Candidatus Chlorohelix sp.]|uniref:hypothetical protein n=1 Tax=Candidatus Chlorohelix sp. TaxID=3139201 RepID=UPI0030509E1D
MWDVPTDVLITLGIAAGRMQSPFKCHWCEKPIHGVANVGRIGNAMYFHPECFGEYRALQAKRQPSSPPP